MDLSAISGLTGVGALNAVGAGSEVSAASLTGMLTEKNEKADGTLFSAIFNSALDNIKTTNSHLSDEENEEIKFALAEGFHSSAVHGDGAGQDPGGIP